MVTAAKGSSNEAPGPVPVDERARRAGGRFGRLMRVLSRGPKAVDNQAFFPPQSSDLIA